MAQSAYRQASGPTRTDRDAEYAAFGTVTRRLKAIDGNDKDQFQELCEAVTLNQRLWSTLLGDLSLDGNGLPDALRAQLISLALFVNRHTHAVLSGRGSVDILIEINTAIMKGLGSQAPAQ